MGGGYYHRDVRQARKAVGSTRSSDHAFEYDRRARRGEVRQVHDLLNIRGQIRECRDSEEHPDSTPIVVGMDVTGSRGEDARLVYEAVPSMMGILRVTEVVPDPEVLFSAIGDANSDRFPLQVGQFESDRRMDEQLSSMVLEGGGGGSGEESYELLAYYLAYKTELDSVERGKKGYLFFTADEAPYPTVSRRLVESLIGDRLEADLDTQKVFRDLLKKFVPFVVFPRTSRMGYRAGRDDPYNQDVILRKWRRYIPAENILMLENAASSVEVMIGALALHSGSMNIEQFAADMQKRKVSADRREDVLEALRNFAQSGAFESVDAEVFE